MPPVNLAIIGASARAAAESACRAGMTVTAADCFADLDLARIAQAVRITDNPDQLPRWLTGSEADAWIYTGGLENSPRLVAQLAAIKPLWGNDRPQIRRVRSVKQLARLAATAGCRVPPTLAARSSQARQIVRTSACPWLFKSLRSSGGAHIRPVTTAAEPAAVTDPRFHLAHRAVIQQHVEGQSLAALYVANTHAARYLGVSRQLVGEPEFAAQPFQYCGSIAPWLVDATTHRKLADLGELIARRCGLQGLFGIDLLVADDQIWVLEVNPRYTAAVEVWEDPAEDPSGQRPRQPSLLAVHADACAHGILPPPTAPRPSHAPSCRGKAILFAQAMVNIDADRAASLLARSIPIHGLRLADIPAGGSTIPPTRPILTILVEGDDPSHVRRRLAEQSAALRAELEA